MLVTLFGTFHPKEGFLTFDATLNVADNVKIISNLLGWWLLEVDDGTIPPTITGIHRLKCIKPVLYRKFK